MLIRGINIALAAIGWVFFGVTLLSLYGLLAIGLGWADGATGFRGTRYAGETSTTAGHPDRRPLSKPTERSNVSAPVQKAPPLSIDCITCGARMELIAVEPEKHWILYTYRCIKEQLQELPIAKP